MWYCTCLRSQVNYRRNRTFELNLFIDAHLATLYRVSQKSLEFFSKSCISVNSLNFWMLFVFIESATNGLSKTCLNLKIAQAVPKLWNKYQTLPKNVYGEIVYSYEAMLFYASRQLWAIFWYSTKSNQVIFNQIYQCFSIK